MHKTFGKKNFSNALADKVGLVKQERKMIVGKVFIEHGIIYVSYRVFNCILVHFIPLPVFIFFLFFFFISILFLSTRFPCSLYQRGWDCTGVGGTIPRGQSLCESMSLCRCLVFILCMPVCNYTLRLTLCAVYG